MKRRDFTLFLIASGILGISQSIDGSFFNNFLNDTFQITVFQRTLLEIPRELPGFMVVFVSTLLIFLGDYRIAAISNLVAGIGMFAMGMSENFSVMLVWLLVYSTGQHLFMPVSNSIGMNFADKNNIGKRLGEISGINTAVYLFTSLITFFIFRSINVNYKIAFSIGAAALIVASILIFCMKPIKTKKASKKLVLKKEYTIFYLLSMIYGARKQIFTTFGPWVLIKVFSQGVSTFAILGFIIAGVGMFFKPYIGRLIDKRGEKYVLRIEAVGLILICLGYGFSEKLTLALGIPGIAVAIVCICYAVDQILTAAGMARATYLRKIALSDEDVSPTLSMGISIDHIMSMTIPFIGGFLWNLAGYEFVFIGGAVLALISLLLTSKVNIKADI